VRLNSLDFNALRERLTRPVENVRQLIIQSSLADRFISTFEQQVDLNPPYILPRDTVYQHLFAFKIIAYSSVLFSGSF